jgi:hypothetical protein
MQRLKNAALLLCFVYVFLGSVDTKAATISIKDFVQLQDQYRNVSLSPYIQNPAAYVDENSHSAEENIYLSHLILNQLALVKSPTLVQRAWREAQSKSTRILSMPSTEHVNQSLIVVHIANAANMVDRHWQAYEVQNEFKQRWESGGWSWAEYFLEQSSVKRMAMVFWLDDLSDSEVQLLAESYLEEGLQYDLGNNRQLSLLLKRAPSTELFSVLWQRPSDAYSHHVLKGIIDEGENVEEIILATQNPKLSSQALFSLVKTHSDQTNVQSFLREAIESEKLSSATLGTLRLLGDDRFRSQLLRHYQQQPTTTFTRQVVKQLGGEIQ